MLCINNGVCLDKGNKMLSHFLAANVVQDPNDENKWYYVSTINRDSSAEYYPHRYAETIVFEWDVENQKKGNILKGDECSEGSTWTHERIVGKLRLFGMKAFEENGEDE